MKFILITGPPAVGKMTVGRHLAAQTGLKLFHNHLSLELANQFFDFSTPPFKHLDRVFRFEIFKTVATSDLKGLIFTLVWAFDLQEDADYVEEIMTIFRAEGAELFCVELTATLDARLFRNVQPDRIAAKPSKKDTEFSEKMLLKHETEYRMNSLEGEIIYPNYLKVDNTNLSPKEVAGLIQGHFDL